MKNRKGEITVGTLIIMFIGIVIAFAFLQAIFNQQSILTNKQPIANEIISISSVRNGSGTTCNINSTPTISIAKAGKAASDCSIENFVLTNYTKTYTFVSGTDYNLNTATGKLTFYNTTAASTAQGCNLNSTYASYNYCEEGYNKDSSSRTVAGLIGLFATLILLAYLLETGKLDEIFNM